jgi:hypothetical protein
MRLTEINNSGSGNDAIISFIKEKCSDILVLYRENRKVLYRGIASSEKYLIDESPVNRLPRDTPRFLSFAIDDKLQAAGFKALRSNSIFCTGRENDAIAYADGGSLYVIFPVNGFDYTYCKYRDLTEEMEYNVPQIQNMSTDKFIKDLEFKDTDLGFAMHTGVEVYLHGKYAAVRYNSFSTYWFQDWLGVII